MCDGRNDCLDNSDEADDNCRTLGKTGRVGVEVAVVGCGLVESIWGRTILLTLSRV